MNKDVKKKVLQIPIVDGNNVGIEFAKAVFGYKPSKPKVNNLNKKK